MNFENFIENGQVRKASRDLLLVRSLVEMAEKDLTFLKSLKVNSNSCRKIMSNHYDVLRSILEAIASFDGYKIYSHEAFTYFLKEKGESLMADKFDRFRKIRNGINYYGKDISVNEVKENAEEIIKLIIILKNKYLDKLE